MPVGVWTAQAGFEISGEVGRRQAGTSRSPNLNQHLTNVLFLFLSIVNKPKTISVKASVQLDGGMLRMNIYSRQMSLLQ